MLVRCLMKLPRRPPSLAALAIVPVVALLTARGGERPVRADDGLDLSRGPALLASRGAPRHATSTRREAEPPAPIPF